MNDSFAVLQTWKNDKLRNVDGIVDDLHIHEIDARFQHKREWIAAVRTLIPYVFSKSLSDHELSRVAIAIPLNTDVHADLFAVSPSRLNAIDLCFTPPSIYVAPMRSNFLEFGPWTQPGNEVRIIENDPWATGDRRLRFVLVDSVSFDNPVRTLWIYAVNC